MNIWLITLIILVLAASGNLSLEKPRFMRMLSRQHVDGGLIMKVFVFQVLGPSPRRPPSDSKGVKGNFGAAFLLFDTPLTPIILAGHKASTTRNHVRLP